MLCVCVRACVCARGCGAVTTRSHGRSKSAVEALLTKTLEGSALQGVTAKGRQSRDDGGESLVPVVMAGKLRGIRRKVRTMRPRPPPAPSLACTGENAGARAH